MGSLKFQFQAWKRFQTGTVEELIDPNMGLEENPSKVRAEIIRAMHVALLCTQEIPSLRPTASGVMRMLQKREGLLLVHPTRPPFIDETTMEFQDMGSDSSVGLSDGHLFSVATVSDYSFWPR